MQKEEKIAVPKSFLKRLKRKVQALKILTEISPVISSTLDLKELMTIVMEKAKGVMNAGACSILLYNRETDKLEFEVAICGEDTTSDILKKKITLDIGQGIAGWVAKNKKLLVIKDVRKDTRFFQEADKATGFITKSIIAVPLMGRRGLIGVAEIINPRKKEYDPEILQILSTHFAIAIENALFHRESIEKERIKQELEIAASLQKSFLPELPTYQKAGVKVTAVNIPAKLVGGDLYDVIEPVDGKVGVFIGDVSGKGVSAALYMAKIISDFRYNALTVESPEIVMNRLNTVLSKAPRGMFLTATYMIIDSLSGSLKVSVAGHPPFVRISGNDVRPVSVIAGPPLGIVADEYSSSTLTLQKNDRLLMLTDGVFEAKNREGQRIGFDPVVQFIRKHAGEKQLANLLTEHVRAFSKGAEMADDLTIVEVTFL